MLLYDNTPFVQYNFWWVYYIPTDHTYPNVLSFDTDYEAKSAYDLLDVDVLHKIIYHHGAVTLSSGAVTSMTEQAVKEHPYDATNPVINAQIGFAKARGTSHGPLLNSYGLINADGTLKSVHNDATTLRDSSVYMPDPLVNPLVQSLLGWYPISAPAPIPGPDDIPD